MAVITLPPAWSALVGGDPHVAAALARLNAVLPTRSTLPPRDRLLAALGPPPSAVRVIILGQDPYPTPGHAHGLAFALAPGRSDVPRSLRNIVAEVTRDVGAMTARPDLTAWVDQGVLLLNRWLSLDADLRDAWDVLTGACLRQLWRKQTDQPLVAMLWGRPAITAAAWMLTPLPSRRLVLTASHPSPLSFRRPSGTAPAFQGCGHFSTANRFLVEHGGKPVAW